VRDRGRTARTRMLLGRAGRTERFIFVLPKFLAVGGVERARDFISFLARKNEQLVANERRRGVAFADGHFPFLREFLGPGLRRFEVTGLRVAIGAAPLRPVLRERNAGRE